MVKTTNTIKVLIHTVVHRNLAWVCKLIFTISTSLSHFLDTSRVDCIANSFIVDWCIWGARRQSSGSEVTRTYCWCRLHLITAINSGTTSVSRLYPSVTIVVQRCLKLIAKPFSLLVVFRHRGIRLCVWLSASCDIIRIGESCSRLTSLDVILSRDTPRVIDCH